MKNYLIIYTVYYAKDKFQKQAGIEEYVFDKEKFYGSWHLKFEKSKKIRAKNDESAKEEAETIRDHFVHLLEQVRVIDVTLDELMEIRDVNINNMKRRSFDEVFSGRTNYHINED